MGNHDPETVTGKEALQRLLDGNKRYVDARQTHPDQEPDRRLALRAGQHPFAVILGCADSRVPPEVIFDQGLGDLFVIRVAGNVLDDMILGSMEYAGIHLNTPLIMVLGHFTDLVSAGRLLIVAAYYDLDTGVVEILESKDPGPAFGP